MPDLLHFGRKRLEKVETRLGQAANFIAQRLGVDPETIFTA